MQLDFQFLEEDSPSCRKCGSKEVVRQGRVLNYTRMTQKQKYQCKRCGLVFSAGTWFKYKYPKTMIDYALELYGKGYSSREVSNKLGKPYGKVVSPRTIIGWIRKFRPESRGTKQMSQEARDLRKMHQSEAASKAWASLTLEERKSRTEKMRIGWQRLSVEKRRLIGFNKSMEWKRKRNTTISPRTHVVLTNEIKYPRDVRHQMKRSKCDWLNKLPWRTFWNQIYKEMPPLGMKPRKQFRIYYYMIHWLTFWRHIEDGSSLA